MPQILTRPHEQNQPEGFVSSAALPTHRKRWTQQDCEYLERLGFLPDRYELIDGEVVEKVGQNKPHAYCVTRALFWLGGIFAPECIVTQATMEVSSEDRTINRPEPDAFVLTAPPILNARPHEAKDVRFIVEVCDTTQHDDLRIKPGLYARAGVAEYWVLDLPTRHLIVHRQVIDGAYSDITAYAEDESVAPLAAPSHAVRIGNLLPPAEAAQTL